MKKKPFGKPTGIKAKRIQDRILAATRGMGNILDPTERLKLSIKDAEIGCCLGFRGKVFLVEGISRYDETKGSKFEKKTGDQVFELKLFCLQNGETAYIEWEEDDEVEISLTIQEVTFRELRDEEGASIDEDDLDSMVNEEGCFFLNGKLYVYDDDWPTIYYRDANGEDGEGDNVYMYDLVTSDGEYLSIEEWDSGSGNEEYQLFLSIELYPDEVEIICFKGE
ncbi:DUF4178 domain-containing protein [Candidatus Pacearchaeota archaeon]|nr:DUF4178 domain-containing protein [Candidatus Pacearchaeota archaeon]